jgi:hypothetical protein
MPRREQGRQPVLEARIFARHDQGQVRSLRPAPVT